MAGSSDGHISPGNGDAVSVAILILLMFISCILVGYVSLFIYTRYKRRKDEHYPGIEFFPTTKVSSWLDGERRPLIPGSVHTRTVQPMFPSESDDDDVDNDDSGKDLTDFRERDFNKLGRIIFVMRYHKKREELMVRLVQIEGLPVSKEFYSPNSAYVDVQLKYTGSPNNSTSQEVQRPPRLDICLQQVYYFIISTQQMMSHSLEFQINTFDDQFRRYVSGMVAVNLCVELADDILTGNEVVFVKDIVEPFKFSAEQYTVDEDDDFVSAVSDTIEDGGEEKYKEFDDATITNSSNNQNNESRRGSSHGRSEKTVTSPSPPRELSIDAILQTAEERSVSSSLATSSSQESLASSNMSWEPEVSTELLSTSINSIYYRCSSEADLTHLITGGGGGEGWAGAPLTADKRSHSIGYLPTYEWTVTDIPFDDHHDFFPTTTNPDDSERQQEEGPSVETTTTGKKSLPNYYKIYDDDEEDEFEIGDEETSNKNTTSQIKPPPESFYTLVPAITPLHGYKTMEQHLTELNGCGAASSHASDPSATQTRKVAYKKQSKLKHHHQHPKPKVGRTFSSSLHSNKKQQQHGKLRLHRNLPPLERSSSWPSLVLTADGDK